jgi:hypothetical protein
MSSFGWQPLAPGAAALLADPQPALAVKVIDFASPTAVGMQVVEGVGFKAKALLFFCGTDSGSDNTFQASAMIGVGMATAPDEECAYSAAAIDAGANADCSNRSQADKCILLEYPTVSPVIAAELVAIHEDGFTINWTTVDATARRVTVVAFGGTDITDAYAGQITVPTSGATVSTTAPGFQPTGIIFVHADAAASGSQQAHFQFGIGFADADLNQYVLKETSLDGAASSDCARMQRSDAVYINQDQNATEDGRAALQSMDANGFTLSISNNPGGACPVGYLAFAGPPIRVGTETQATSVTTKQTSLDIDSAGLVLAGAVTASVASAVNDMEGFFGASDGVDDRVNFWGDDDGQGTMVTNRLHDTANVASHSQHDDTTQAEAAVSGMTGGFTLDWTTADATARAFGYFAIGTLVVSTFVPKVVRWMVRPS